jgi:HEPN domain-containing protein
LVSAKLYEELVSRAIYFYRVSSYDASAGRYDIALFHLEQAVQLALKAYLLKTLGDFPKIRSLKGSKIYMKMCETRSLIS